MLRFASFIRFTSFLIIAVALLVLIGWKFGIMAFTTILPGLVGMNPFTALSFLAISSWQLLRLHSRKTSRLFYAVRIALAVFVLLVGSLRLVDILAGTNYGLDKLLTISNLAYGFISPVTAASFTLLSIAMLLETALKRFPNVVLFLLTPVFLLSICSLFGYLIGSNDIFTLKPFKPMALHTTVCFLALVVCFLFLFPYNVFTRTVWAKDSGGFIARSLLPYIIFVPMALGFLRYQGEQLGLYDTGFGVAIVVVGALSTFLVVMVHQLYQLSRIDQQRSIAESKVKEHAHEVECANRELEQRNKELELFTYLSHHDLQEPLRKLMLFSDRVKTDSYDRLTPASQKHLERMLAAAHQMRDAIRDVLEFTALTKKDALELVDLNEVVGRVKSELEVGIRKRSAIIQSERLPIVKAAPDQLHRLFCNLIDNALKFSKEGEPPVITIGCKKLKAVALNEQNGMPTKSYFEITVSDNGIGFNPEAAEKIFDMFQRLHPRDDYPGSGIGLAFCKKVVQNHEGKIWAESISGEGATFKVLLPIS